MFLVLSGAVFAISGTVSAQDVSAPDTEPWALLSGVRDQLRSRSPLEARFTQTFLPSGFTVGDSESGALYVDLPRCLRFEYREPFPKDFLLCGDWVYTWNPGEPSGRRFLTNDGEAEGLDLLRLEVETLRERYRASVAVDDPERTVVDLVPIDPDAEIRSASVELGPRPESMVPAARGLQALAYEDRTGNRTRFEITAYRDLDERTAFQPPALEWLQD